MRMLMGVTLCEELKVKGIYMLHYGFVLFFYMVLDNFVIEGNGAHGMHKRCSLLSFVKGGFAL